MSKFVVTANVDGKKEFWAIDRNSGGYPYWTNFIGHAKFFNSESEAEAVLQPGEDWNDREMVNGNGKRSIWPGRMLHSALNLCNEKIEGEGFLAIEELQFKIVYEKKISAKLPIEQV